MGCHGADVARLNLYGRCLESFPVRVGFNIYFIDKRGKRQIFCYHNIGIPRVELRAVACNIVTWGCAVPWHQKYVARFDMYRVRESRTEQSSAWGV